MNLENITQLGTAGITVVILLFIVKYFIATLDKKEVHNIELTNKFIDMAKENAHTHVKLIQSIDQNTIATKASTENLTGLMHKVLQNSGRRKI